MRREGEKRNRELTTQRNSISEVKSAGGTDGVHRKVFQKRKIRKGGRKKRRLCENGDIDRREMFSSSWMEDGKLEPLHDIHCTILIRQRKPRAFEDNAAVIADDKGTPKGSEMRSSAAREAVERSYHIASVATIIKNELKRGREGQKMDEWFFGGFFGFQAFMWYLFFFCLFSFFSHFNL